MITTAAGTFVARLRELLPQRLGEAVATLAALPPGGNNTLWKAVTGRGRSFLIKRYAARPGDDRERLGREIGALGFLWGQGVRCIPEPAFAVPELGVGVFAFVEGAPVRLGEVTAADVSAAADFLVLLRRLAGQPEAAALPPASEAVFAPAGYREVIERRREGLLAVASRAEEGLERFLRQDLAGLLEEAAGFARAEAGRRGVPWEEGLDQAWRTLSPSDFGFHNALRRPDGTLVFVDFEYFGWDDPAKAVADFLHHPAARVPPLLRAPFVEAVVRGFPKGTAVADRLAVVYPLTGVNWCLIALNPFLRREDGEPAAADLCRDRLAAARERASRLRQELGSRAFPLRGGL